MENITAAGERVRQVVHRSGDVRLTTLPALGATAGAAAAEPELGDREIRSGVLSGFVWSMVNSGVGQVAQLVTSIVLVRLLSPRDYGLAGMTLLFQGLVVVVTDVGMGAALIQRREITEADRSTVFWFSVAVGTFLTLAGVAVSGPIADFYGQPAVRPLFAVTSLCFLLIALQMTPDALMNREMQFRLINLRLAIATVIGCVVGITAGALGAGAWALVLQQVTMSAAGAVFIWIASPWKPRFMFSRQSLRDLGGYGSRLFGSNLLSYMKSNGDNLLVGRFLGSAALGAYAVAYNLMFLPLVRVIIPIQATLFPAFSHWQDDPGRVASVWLRVLRLLGAALIPAMIGFIVVAPDFVVVILGDKWRSAVPVLQLLALVALAQSFALSGQRVLAAVDKTKVVLRFAALDAILTLAAFAVGLQWGIVGVSLCYVVVSVPLQVLYMALTARAVDASLADVARTLAGVALATAVMAGACLGARLFLVSAHVGAPVRLGLVIAVGIVVYAAACFLAEPEVLREVRNVRSRRHSAEPLAVAT